MIIEYDVENNTKGNALYPDSIYTLALVCSDTLECLVLKSKLKINFINMKGKTEKSEMIKHVRKKGREQHIPDLCL